MSASCPVSSSAEVAVTITPFAEVRVISLRAVLENYRAQKHLWSEVTAFCEKHGIAITGACFTIYYDMEYKEKDVDAEVCLPIKGDAAIPSSEDASWGNIQVRVLPAIARAAVTTYVGNYDGLPPVYHALYTWISANGHTPHGPVREVYLAMNPEDTSEKSFVTQLQQPLA